VSNLDRKEIEKIASLSCFKLTEGEALEFVAQVKEVLEYTEVISNVSLGAEVEATRSINVFREDKVIKKDSSSIISIAPKSDGKHFVVPRTID
jgi:aspartyl/glutamyl-tRNA(Asn/Gln) amidotransferase C subunit